MENKRSYYAIIPATVRYDNSLPANAKLLYGEITALCNQSGLCWASNTYFGELYGVDEKTVRRWLNALIEARYIRRTVQYDNDGKTIIQRCLSLAEPAERGGDKNVRPGQKCPRGTDKNVPGGGDKNVRYNNTSNNNTSEYNPQPPLSQTEKLESMISKSELTEKIKQSLLAWLEYKNHKYTEQGLRSLISIVSRKTEEYGESVVSNLIEECMSNTWKGIIWDKLTERKTVRIDANRRNYTEDELNAMFNRMTEEDI